VHAGTGEPAEHRRDLVERFAASLGAAHRHHAFRRGDHRDGQRRRVAPNSEIHALDAGHFAWEEAAEEHGRLIVDWVSGGHLRV
jgi:hypothetical protein